MTRKRFVKLLMSKGYSRNEANQIADTRKKDQPYAELCFTACFAKDFPDMHTRFMEAAQRIVTEVCAAMDKFAEDLKKVAESIHEAVPGIIENMRRLQEADEGATL